MPLDVDIALINTIEGNDLSFESLDMEECSWSAPPPDRLPPFEYKRCHCSGPSSGYEIALKYGPHICRIFVTAWGVTYKKSTPSKNSIELVQVKKQSPYRLEMIIL